MTTTTTTTTPAADVDPSIAWRVVADLPERREAVAALAAIEERVAYPTLPADELDRLHAAELQAVVAGMAPDARASRNDLAAQARARVSVRLAQEREARAAEDAAALEAAVARVEADTRRAHLAVLEPANPLTDPDLPGEARTHALLEELLAATTLQGASADVLLEAAQTGRPAEQRHADRLLARWPTTTEDGLNIRRRHQAIVQARVPASLRTALDAERQAVDHLTARARRKLTVLQAVRANRGDLAGLFVDAERQQRDAAQARAVADTARKAWAPIVARATGRK